MPAPRLTRETALSRLHASYATLLTTTAGLRQADLESIRFTEDWTGIDALRHLEVWAELNARCLADWLGPRAWVLESSMHDDFNMEMVASRADRPLPAIIAGLLRGYEQYAKTLLECSDAELQERALAPWNEDLSRLEMVASSLGHDLMHLNELNARRREQSL